MDKPSCDPVLLGPARAAGIAIGDAADQDNLMDTCGQLARDLRDSYFIRVDGHDPRRQPRFIAVARRLEIHPYAVVTADPVELRSALACGSAAEPPPDGAGE